MSWVHICGFCNYFKSKHDSFCGTAKTAFLTNVWSIFFFSKSSSKNQCLLIQIMWDQFFPVKLPQIVCTNSRNTIKSVEINGKTNCAAQSWHHWVFRKNVTIFEWNIITNSSTFFFVKYAANVFQWQTFRSRESNHDLSWRLTPNAMPNSKFFQEPRTLMINSCARYFIESKTFIFFFYEQHRHARSFNFFFHSFPLWL